MASDPICSGGISTIMPVFNGARYIEAAIESLVSQSVPPCQILVIDDGSTDDSGARAVAAGKGLVQLVQQPNLGINAAREQGRALVTGDYVHFMDADDLCPQGSLATLREALATHQDWVGVFGKWQNFWIEELAAEQEREESAHLRGEQVNFIVNAALFRNGWLSGAEAMTDHCWHGPIVWLADAQRSGAKFGRSDTLTLKRRIHHTNFSRGKSADDLVNLVLNLHRGARNRRNGRNVEAAGDDNNEVQGGVGQGDRKGSRR
jgi:glycosyltransferase involved in cell wall biosynthesis